MLTPPSPDSERRHRRVSFVPVRDRCSRCEGPLEIKVRGRDHRIVCRSCMLPPENCHCRAQVPPAIV